MVNKVRHSTMVNKVIKLIKWSASLALALLYLHYSIFSTPPTKPRRQLTLATSIRSINRSEPSLLAPANTTESALPSNEQQSMPDVPPTSIIANRPTITAEEQPKEALTTPSQPIVATLNTVKADVSQGTALNHLSVKTPLTKSEPSVSSSSAQGKSSIQGKPPTYSQTGHQNASQSDSQSASKSHSQSDSKSVPQSASQNDSQDDSLSRPTENTTNALVNDRKNLTETKQPLSLPEPASSKQPSPQSAAVTTTQRTSAADEPLYYSTDSLDDGFRLLQRNSLLYPRQAQQLRKSGQVIFELLINQHGAVSEVLIIEATEGWGFVAAIRQAYQQALYSPPTRNNRPVKVRLRKEVVFKP